MGAPAGTILGLFSAQRATVMKCVCEAGMVYIA